ncbi:MAG: dihydroorotate dehydrogenase electron transfer subunit [Pseudomonadota bacterium]
MSKPDQSHRGTIFVEEAAVLSQQRFEGDQFVLRVQAPECARSARAGSFAHLTCDPALPMRRPLSIMRVDAEAGWVEFLYKIVGDGLRLLSQRAEGDCLSVMGPIGQPFRLNPERRRPLLIGGGVGIPPMVFLAEDILAMKDGARDGGTDTGFEPLVLMGSEIPFPFRTRPSTILVQGMPAGVIGTMPLLEDQGVPVRLASLAGYPGCYEGYVTDLAMEWLDSLSDSQRDEVEIYACGPTPMLKAAAAVARRYDLPAQVSLEEYMACAVGGCAGCTVEVKTPDGPAMKRVCVDGPVFDAATVF